jgi:two-component system, LytTR family, response regulator
MESSHDAITRQLRPQARVRTLIVDDEPLARDRIRSLLARADHIEIVGECANGLEALEAIETDVPDLVFLDVEMPELNGLAVLEAIPRERCPQVVFVTAHDQYLQRAFEVHALDYLRKPFNDRRFYDALRHACERVRERLGQARIHEAVHLLMTEMRERSPLVRDRLIVQDREKETFHVVRAQDIDWVEASDGGVRIHVGAQTHIVRLTLAEVEARLDPAVFLRIHRSYIINRTRIESMKRLWKGEYMVVLKGGKQIGTGRTYREAIEAFLASG